MWPLMNFNLFNIFLKCRPCFSSSPSFSARASTPNSADAVQFRAQPAEQRADEPFCLETKATAFSFAISPILTTSAPNGEQFLNRSSSAEAAHSDLGSGSRSGANCFVWRPIDSVQSSFSTSSAWIFNVGRLSKETKSFREAFAIIRIVFTGFD